MNQVENSTTVKESVVEILNNIKQLNNDKSIDILLLETLVIKSNEMLESIKESTKKKEKLKKQLNNMKKLLSI